MSLFRRLLCRNVVFNTLKPTQQRIFLLSAGGLIAFLTITLLTGIAYTHHFSYASTPLALSSASPTHMRNIHTDMQSSSGIDDLSTRRRFIPTHTPVIHKQLAPTKKSTPANIQSQPVARATSPATTAQPTPPPASTTSASGAMIPVNVTAYALQGRMADGNWTHWGACAVYTGQFPFGTLINIYNQDGSFNRQCIAEDTGGAITYGHIDLAFPGDENAAIQWGRQYLYARVARWGW